MALIPAQYAEGYQTGTITLKSGITGTIQNMTCYKKDGIVCISCRLISTTVTADKSIFSIPVGFRPFVETNGMGAAYINGSKWEYGSVRAKTDGDILFLITSSEATMLAFAMTYPAA